MDDKPRRRGRPRHQPTEQARKTVEAMAGFGVPQHDIARTMNISAETLRLHYRDVLDAGATKANCAVAKNLFRIAQGTGRDAVIACIFWLKARAGWREASHHDVAREEQRELPASSAENGTDWDALLAAKPH